MSPTVVAILSYSVLVIGVCIPQQRNAALLATTDALAIDSDAQTTLANAVDLAMGFEAFSDAAADAEIGSDLGMDLALENSRTAQVLGTPGSDSNAGGNGGGPATLAEYCAGKGTAQEETAKVKVGAKVKADWNDYGTMYPGRIKDKNSDGTIDVKYDDGFSEKRVSAENYKVVQRKKKQQETKEKSGSARNDPACKLQDFLGKLKQQLKELNKMISEWAAAQRAKVTGAKPIATPPPSLKPVVASSPSAAPPAAPATAEETDDLEKLKSQLADRDAYIKELKAQLAELDQQLKESYPSAAPVPSGVKTVADLIAEYKAKIAERDDEIKDLLQEIKQKQKEVDLLSGKQLSLKEIEAAVDALEMDVNKAKRKRDDLEESGELDPELRSVIDSIIKAIKKLRKKVDKLLALQAEAEAERLEAEREAKTAAEVARKSAQEEGLSAEEAEKRAKEAENDSKVRAQEKMKNADLEAMKAAQEVGKDLEEAEKGADKLDTGLHPHGDKWWRYRYEHSYIEALLMVFISFLMVFWSKLFTELNVLVHAWANVNDGSTAAAEEELEQETHGAVLVSWLRFFAEQMFVCVFVFLTVWLIAKSNLIDFFPLIIKPSEDMRVPTTADEYRRLALDICTIFFFAIVFYFVLMFPVAVETRRVTHELEEHEKESARGGVPEKLRRKSVMSGVSVAVMGGVAQTHQAYVDDKKHFVKYLQREMNTNTDVLEVSVLLGNNFERFPLARYLILNIRVTITNMFVFGWLMWLPVICIFICLMLLHRFAHMGYVRIMCGATAIFVLILIGMSWLTKSLKSHQEEEEDQDGPQEQSIHNKLPTEVIVLNLLQFSLFFMCYGSARMICQPWMWELHFWPVLCLTVVAILTAILFVWIVTPAIPAFVAVMALPPYVDDENMKQLKSLAKEVNQKSSGDSHRV
jgi:hypothetical protein